MPGTLFVVATPIGNLEDITQRAVRVLSEVDVVAAEDTRRTGKLLAHLGISVPMVSFHEHNTRSRLPQLLSRLDAGESVALVSDAGTPGVSDPGVELVQACITHGVPVDPVPGVSAPLAAAIASGFPLVPLTVYGFAPARSKDRTRWLSDISCVHHTLTFFEAPHRVRQTLAAASLALGERPITLARELTKVHQEFLRGTAADILGQLHSERGEFTIVVGPALLAKRPSNCLPSDGDVWDEFGKMTETAGLTRGEAVALVAKKLGRPRREVYAALERAKCSVE